MSNPTEVDELFTNPDRPGRAYFPVTPPPRQPTSDPASDEADTPPVDLDDDVFGPPPAAPGGAKSAGALDEPSTAVESHRAAGIGAAGMIALTGGLIAFHFLGGAVLLVGAAGAALATGAGVAGVRAARNRRAGTGRTRRTGEPRARRGRRLGGAGSPLGGGGRRRGGAGMPKLPKPGTGGRKGGPTAGRKAGKGGPTAGKKTPAGKKPTTGARSAGLLPKRKPRTAAGAKGGRPGGPLGGKGRHAAKGTSPRGLLGGRKRTPAGKGTGAARRAAMRNPFSTGPRRRGPLGALGRMGRGTPKGPAGGRARGNRAAGSQARGNRAGSYPTTMRGRIRQLREQGRKNRATARQDWWKRQDARRATHRDWYRQVWWPRQARRYVTTPARVAYRHVLIPAARWTVWYPIRATIVRPAVSVYRWGAHQTHMAAMWAAAVAGDQYRLLRYRLQHWHRRMIVLARYATTRQAWSAFWVASIIMLGRLMRRLAAMMWAPDPSRYAQPPGMSTPANADAFDDERDSDAAVPPLGAPPIAPLLDPRGSSTPPPPAPAPSGTGASARQRMRTAPRTPQPAPAMASGPAPTGGHMHPAQQALVEASDQFVRGFEPRSIPDLNRYLGSQPDAMVQTGHQYRALVSRLVAEFPGAMAVHGFFGDVCDGYPALAERARTLHDAYRQIHADDLARHENPRVNEHLADVARSANGGNLPTIGGGDTMHENHACMVAAYRTHIAGYEPELCASGAENAWDDFVVYLSGQPVMYYILGQHMAAFAEKLVTAYPVEADVHGYYFALASGYASLSDRSGELTNGFLNANANDTQRHTDPRVNEKWADFANK